MSKIKKHILPVIITAVVLFVFLGETPAHVADTFESDIPRIVKRYDAAWNRKDAKMVGNILADSYVYFSSTGGVTTRKQTLEFLMSPRYILKSADRSEIAVYSSRNTVVVSSRWKGNGMFNEEEFNDDQRCSMVFTKEGKGWELLSEHCTQIVSK